MKSNLHWCMEMYAHLSKQAPSLYFFLVQFLIILPFGKSLHYYIFGYKPTKLHHIVMKSHTS